VVHGWVLQPHKHYVTKDIMACFSISKTFAQLTSHFVSLYLWLPELKCFLSRVIFFNFCQVGILMSAVFLRRNIVKGKFNVVVDLQIFENSSKLVF
jgi:hypothetical protein